jgi:hypothetical protein
MTEDQRGLFEIPQRSKASRSSNTFGLVIRTQARAAADDPEPNWQLNGNQLWSNLGDLF